MASRVDLIRALTDYRPTDSVEQRHRIDMLDLAAASQDPFDRHQFVPGHFTASAFVLHPEGDRVVLVHHARLGIWVQPGGHIEQGDATLGDAAAREVAEETGLRELVPIAHNPFDLDIHIIPALGDQPSHLHHDVRFAFLATTTELAPNHEVLEVAWIGPGDLMALGADHSVLRALEKLLGG
jgi:8-oxo-dGTP pyrophosphatase MutT (NUDIX family)